ncbi:TPA: type II toxin-antitoxin system HipA family toxin [Flavobacterium psychrophilum]|uniref:type II toxin-antitoxin system HipA family toxin n=1 Tax=Flavobacterium psychrophilum TaxID=96345 RepID=UPI00073E610C|nr:type II toxin-antitoxin system HipA family toxin [Flavobacterium psychrophilum]SNB97651.1 HIPA protein [Flavobacterium psychrophilum]GAQ49970.1 addiction module toxin protein HipA [Flavobacterium psychrophilum]GAW90569.1 toxin HipA [Flavobacterium psychrophilum]GEJ32501.1 toxin HipA [Flavobacterium psychrophilum]GEJ33371.1 toxin HipA [Flavobacterium psychrophilum]
MITNAFIKIWDEIVGAVSWNLETGIASFEYEPKFISKNWDLAPLKMPLASSNRRVFSFPELKNIKTFKGLPGLLADVLPDDYGNQLINNWLAQNGRPENSMNPVEMLCFIGTRGMGALEFEPSQFKANKRAFDIEVDNLVNISQKMLQKREGFETNLNKDEQQAMIDILKIGTSAGGARPKAIIAYNEKTGLVKSGQTNAPKGFEHWLIKLDTVSDIQFGESTGYGRIEMAYYLMAKACEIDMMECRLMEENGRAHFMTKRFDRQDGETKHHIQTLCAMQHYDFNQITSFSYEQLFQTMRLLKLPYPQAEQLFRRMAFNVIARNCDDHTKNFAFKLKQNESWELTPAYDVCFAYRPESTWVSQHNLSINGKRKDFTKEDLLQVAKSMNIRKANQIIQQINDVVSKWATFADEAKVKNDFMEQISKSHLFL